MVDSLEEALQQVKPARRQTGDPEDAARPGRKTMALLRLQAFPAVCILGY